jgi:hypothetical protein
MIQGKKKELDKEEKTDSTLKAASVVPNHTNPVTEAEQEIVNVSPDVTVEEEKNENP